MRAFFGEQLVTEYYQDALKQIAGVLRHLPNEGEFRNVDDEQLVDHFLKKALGSSQEGGYELLPLQEINPPGSHSVDHEQTFTLSNNATPIQLIAVKMPLVPFKSNGNALKIRSEQNWPQVTGMEIAASFRWQDDTIEIRARKCDIGRLVRTAEHMIVLINADIELRTPEFRSQVLNLVKERRLRIAQAQADVEAVRRELGIKGDLPAMAPENPATVVVHDLYFDGEILRSRRELVEADDPGSHVLNVGWGYAEQPPGYFSVGGGVIYVRETDRYLRMPKDGKPPYEEAPTSLGHSRYWVREDTARGGTMIILILPDGYTSAGAVPAPIGAKAFHDRVALFWRRDKDTGSLQVTWTLGKLEKSLQHEVERLNAEAFSDLSVTSKITKNIVIERQAPAAEPSSSPVSVFYSYSHKDERYRNKLETHLSLLNRKGLISEWHDRKILAGKEVDDEIDRNLAQAQVVLLLVSADFLASDYCYKKEMTLALKRHDQGTATVIPIIVRPVDWKIAPLRKLKALPKDGNAVIEWRPQDKGWADVATGIREVVEDLIQKGNASR